MRPARHRVDALRHAQAFVIFGQIAARRAAQRYRHRLGDASERARLLLEPARRLHSVRLAYAVVEVGQAAQSATLLNAEGKEACDDAAGEPNCARARLGDFDDAGSFLPAFASALTSYSEGPVAFKPLPLPLSHRRWLRMQPTNWPDRTIGNVPSVATFRNLGNTPLSSSPSS